LCGSEKTTIDGLIKSGDYRISDLPTEAFEIWGCGLGLFACRRDSWLRFNSDFYGFGGEEGYIHEKYRKAGRKVWCDPSKVWVHFFGSCGRQIPYPIPRWERVRNYLIGFEELKMDTSELEKHFGPGLVAEARAKMSLETAVTKPQEAARIKPSEKAIPEPVEKR
jgi:hypothetical protein